MNTSHSMPAIRFPDAQGDIFGNRIERVQLGWFCARQQHLAHAKPPPLPIPRNRGRGITQNWAYAGGVAPCIRPILGFSPLPQGRVVGGDGETVCKMLLTITQLRLFISVNLPRNDRQRNVLGVAHVRPAPRTSSSHGQSGSAGGSDNRKEG